MANPHPVYSPYHTRPHSQPVPRHQQYPYPVLDPVLRQSSSQPTPGYPRQPRATGPPPVSLRAEFLAASASHQGGRLSTSQHLQPPERSYSVPNHEGELREAVSTFAPSVNQDHHSLSRAEGQLTPAHETNVCSTPQPNGERKILPAPSKTIADELHIISDYIPPRRELPFRSTKKSVAKNDEKETLEQPSLQARASTSAGTNKRKRKFSTANTRKKRPAPNLVFEHHTPPDDKPARQNAKNSSKKRAERSARLKPSPSTAAKTKSSSQASQPSRIPSGHFEDGGNAIVPTDDATSTHVAALKKRSELLAVVKPRVSSQQVPDPQPRAATSRSATQTLDNDIVISAGSKPRSSTTTTTTPAEATPALNLTGRECTAPTDLAINRKRVRECGTISDLIDTHLQAEGVGANILDMDTLLAEILLARALTDDWVYDLLRKLPE